MNAFYRFFRSALLAVVLILLITALSVLATLIPQGREEGFYREKYGPLLFGAIRDLRLDRFFRSIPFLLLTSLFTLNLGVCAVDRILRRYRAGAQKRYGPDLIHIGLLVILVGGVMSFALKREKTFSMGEGDIVELDGRYSIRLLSFQFLKYENGSTKDWISTVSVAKDGKNVFDSFAIEVNRPLRLGGLRVYQASYAREGLAHLKDSDGQILTVRTGEAFESRDSVWYFAGMEQSTAGSSELTAVFEEWKGRKLASVVKAPVSGTVGPYQIAEIASRDLTGLKAVKDPGFFPVIAAMIAISAGLVLTFVQKIREQRL